MKKFIVFLIVFFVVIYCGSVSVLAADYGLLPAPSCKLEISMFYSWFSDNWVPVSLIISEVAALFGGKWSGIIKTAVNIGNLIFKKKK